MGIKKLVFFVIFMFLSSCSHVGNINKNNESLLFHDYAYSLCIGSAFKSEEVRADANRTVNRYLQFSNISSDAYQELRTSMNVWLAKYYKSKSGESLQIMKCNDFFNSGEIQTIYKKYDPCLSKDNWHDENKYDFQCGEG